MLLALLLGLSLAPEHGRWALELPGGWSEDEHLSLPDALFQASSEQGRVWLRELDLSETLDVSSRKLRGVDLHGAASPDRIARLVQQAQDEDLTTVYLGPADGVDSHLGRWVYLDAQGRVGWQLFWSLGEGRYGQLIASGRQVQAWMPGVEEALSIPEATPTVLFDAGRGDCRARQVERAEVLRASRRFEDARTALRLEWEASPRQAGMLELAELRAMGLLYRKAESCIQSAARQHRACKVVEGPALSERDLVLMDSAVACVDQDDEVGLAVRQAVHPLLNPETR